MATMNEVHVKVVPELSDDLKALLGTATEDTLAKVNAGAALTYAIYHCPKDQVDAFFKAMPTGVVKAYAKACNAYGIGFHVDRVDVAGRLDPIKHLPDEG
jgi:ABC-type sugar transport system substrate-binding protein